MNQKLLGVTRLEAADIMEDDPVDEELAAMAERILRNAHTHQTRWKGLKKHILQDDDQDGLEEEL